LLDTKDIKNSGFWTTTSHDNSNLDYWRSNAV